MRKAVRVAGKLTFEPNSTLRSNQFAAGERWNAHVKYPDGKDVKRNTNNSSGQISLPRRRKQNYYMLSSIATLLCLVSIITSVFI